MKNRGAILKKLRELNDLTVKQASQKFECSVGWLSAIENEHPACKISDEKLQEILSLYEFDKHKKTIHGQLSLQKTEWAKANEISYEGAILKYMREKSGKSMSTVAQILNCSIGHIAHIENGYTRVSKTKRDLLVNCYGYSPESFNNFSSADKRSANVPSRYRLNILFRIMTEDQMKSVLAFTSSLINSTKNKGA